LAVSFFPIAQCVTVIEQLPPLSVQGRGVIVAPGSVNRTMPEGVTAVPGDVSLTVTVHCIAGCLPGTGEQLTLVAVVRFCTWIPAVPVLGSKLAPALYVPVICCVPSDPNAGVKVTEQAPLLRVQLRSLKLPVPPLQETVPLGTVEGVVVSVTVAVQVAGPFTASV
jgi:hypothetical protein